MKTITDAEAVVLGLLTEGPAHPYQLEKTAMLRSMRDWTDLSMSTIYKLLRKLERGGHVRSEVELSDDNRARRVYSITQNGRDALEIHLVNILEYPEWPKQRIDIASYFLNNLSADYLPELMINYRRELTRRAEDHTLAMEYMESHGCAWHQIEVVRHTLHLVDGELKWIDGFMKRLNEEHEK